MVKGYGLEHKQFLDFLGNFNAIVTAITIPYIK